MLYVDGEVGRGPERGSDRSRFYESYDLPLSAGAHVFVALVWQLGEIAPRFQVGLAGASCWRRKANTARLSTKSAAWTCKPVDGLLRHARGCATWPGSSSRSRPRTARYPWGIEQARATAGSPSPIAARTWPSPSASTPRTCCNRRCCPNRCQSRGAVDVSAPDAAAWDDPQFIVVDAEPVAEVDDWQALLDDARPLTIPAHSQRRVILDLEDYVCAYPQVQLSGGRGSRVVWLGRGAASGCHQRKQRTARRGGGQNLHRASSRRHRGQRRRASAVEPLWWRSGRYVAVLVETGDEPLTVEGCAFLETRYPLEMESRFRSSDPRLDAVTPLALRSLQMCAHETYMDCPYYEQMMYVGDTRLEALTTYAISPDDRLPRKSILLFGLSRSPNGLTQAPLPGPRRAGDPAVCAVVGGHGLRLRALARRP
ncbi:MAG: hypothetical protein R2854_06160 [Caldilineaceae bacterium]